MMKTMRKSSEKLVFYCKPCGFEHTDRCTRAAAFKKSAPMHFNWVAILLFGGPNLNDSEFLL